MFAALRRFELPWLCLVGCSLFATSFLPPARGAAVVSEPFAGVRYTHRTQTQPRLLSIHIVEINLAHPGIRLLISPGNGATRGENTPRTVRAFVTAAGAQIGLNASFFVSSAEGANYDNRGVVASQGDVYSNFDGDNRPWPVLNISEDNFADSQPGGAALDDRGGDAGGAALQCGERERADNHQRPRDGGRGVVWRAAVAAPA